MGNEQSRPQTPPEERSARAKKKFDDEVERQLLKLEGQGGATTDQNNTTTAVDADHNAASTQPSSTQAEESVLPSRPSQGEQRTLIRDSRNMSRQTGDFQSTEVPLGSRPYADRNGSDATGKVRTLTQSVPPSALNTPTANGSFPASEKRVESAVLTKRSLQDLHPVRVSTASKASKITSESSPGTLKRTEPRNGQEELLPPSWYLKLNPKATRSKDDTGVDVLLQRLKQQIAKTKREHQKRNDLAPLFEEVRNRLHALIFQKVNPQMLRTNRMLHNDGGLSSIFDERYTDGVPWPYDIRADAHELYNKWSANIFETDLLRGIIRGQPDDKRRDKKGHGDRLDKNWPGKVSASYFGQGNLQNGQWWPTQLCALRDGAHGQSQKGIHGVVEDGAYSVLLADGYSDDEDYGNEVLYCGVDSVDGNITPETKSMMLNKNNQPVRLIRTKQCKSNYRPEIGLRYDGLYDVVSWENLDTADSVRQRHRFKLVRRPGQDPFRAEGSAKRPTAEEMDEYRKDKRLRGFEI